MSQIKREWKFRVSLRWLHAHHTRRVANFEESREPAAFGFIRVHRQSCVVTAARMRNVIGAAAHRTSVPSVNDVESQGSMHTDCWMQSSWWLPRSEANARDLLAFDP